MLERKNALNCESVSKFRNGIKKDWNWWRKIPSPVCILCFPTKPFSSSISDGWSLLSPTSSCGIFSQLLFVFHALIPHSGGLQSLQRNGSCCQQLKWVCGCFVWAIGLVILWVFSLYLARIKPQLIRVEVNCCWLLLLLATAVTPKADTTCCWRNISLWEQSTAVILSLAVVKVNMLKLGSLKFLLCASFFPLHFFTPFLVSVKRPAALRQWLTAQVTEMRFCLSLWKCVFVARNSFIFLSWVWRSNVVKRRWVRADLLAWCWLLCSVQCIQALFASARFNNEQKMK